MGLIVKMTEANQWRPGPVGVHVTAKEQTDRGLVLQVCTSQLKGRDNAKTKQNKNHGHLSGA